MKKLYRSDTDKTIAGVIGGIGEYFDIDPVLIRVLWVLIVISTAIFPGILAYILAILIIPQKKHAQTSR